MKKLLALLLALALMLTFVACGNNDDDDDDDDKKPKTSDAADKDDDKDSDKDTDEDKDEDKDDEDSSASKNDNTAAIEEYVEENRTALIAELEQSLSDSGLTCETDIEAVGAGFVVYININELEDVDDDTKAGLQEVYDTMQDTFELLLETMQTELPELEYFTYVVGDKNGEVLATVTAGNP